MTKSKAWYALQHEISLLPTDERRAASLADAIRDYVTARLAEHDETRAAGGSSAALSRGEPCEKCRAMHRSHVAPVPRFAHAVSALADERDALLNRVASLEQAIWEACDSFRSLGCSADADDLESAVRASGNEGESL